MDDEKQLLELLAKHFKLPLENAGERMFILNFKQGKMQDACALNAKGERNLRRAAKNDKKAWTIFHL